MQPNKHNHCGIKNSSNNLFSYLCLAIFMFLIALNLQAISRENNRENNLATPSLKDQSYYMDEQVALLALGKIWLRNYMNTNKIYSDLYVQQYLNQLTTLLLQHSTLHTPGKPSVLAIDKTNFNAFAVPGKIIGLHVGVIMASKTESQLAFIIAHEIAHLQQNHFIRSQQQANKDGSHAMLALLGGIGLILAGAGDMGVAAITSASGYSIQQKLQYSRQYEYEADRAGLNILINSPFNAKGAAASLQGLSQQSQSAEYLEYFQTHPLSIKRVSDASVNTINHKGKANSHKSSDDFFYAKAHIIANSSTKPYLKQQVQQKQATVQINQASNIDLFTIALYALKLDDYATAIKYIEPLFAKNSLHVAVARVYAIALFNSGNKQKAVDTLKKLLAIQPNNYLLTMELAKIMVRVGKVTEGLNYMLAIQKNNNYNLPYWQLLEWIYIKQGNNKTKLYLVQAHKAQLQAHFMKAELHLNQAYKSAGTDELLKSYIKKKHKELKNLAKIYGKVF